MVLIYKRDDPKYANDTSIDFLENGDIRVDWSEYWTMINDYQSHDDELAFSIHNEDFNKLIEAIKEKKPDLKLDENKCMSLFPCSWWRLSKIQHDVFIYLYAAFAEELWYRHIKYLCDDVWIKVYDVVLY